MCSLTPRVAGSAGADPGINYKTQTQLLGGFRKEGATEEDVAGNIINDCDQDNAGIGGRKPQNFLSTVVADTTPEERAHYWETAADRRSFIEGRRRRRRRRRPLRLLPRARDAQWRQALEAFSRTQENSTWTEEGLPGHQEFSFSCCCFCCRPEEQAHPSSSLVRDTPLDILGGSCSTRQPSITVAGGQPDDAATTVGHRGETSSPQPRRRVG